MVTFKHFDRV